jgi:hypothetical protein
MIQANNDNDINVPDQNHNNGQPSVPEEEHKDNQESYASLTNPNGNQGAQNSLLINNDQINSSQVP